MARGNRISLEALVGLVARPSPAEKLPENEAPLRAELLTIDQLVSHARTVAEQHQVAAKRAGNRLLARLNENEEILQTFNRATAAIDRSRHVTPAAEWLLDNFYLIREQIQLARRHLPRHYSGELPRLSQGPSALLPRVYDLVLELISHVDAEVDAKHLSAFVAAYQTITPLQLGELWAVPIMLRLGLIEDLRRITARLSADREDRNLAEFWGDRLEKILESDPPSLVVVVAEMAKAKPPMSAAFVVKLCERLARVNPAAQLARSWLEQHLAAEGYSVEQGIMMESHGQAADQVSISHAITSLRSLSVIDWRKFVETQSVVEQTLKNDPADTYRAMDFSTRDRYRHAVERISRQGQRSEKEVAEKAVELAEASAREKGRGDRTAHAGYYLIDRGQAALEKAVQARWPWSTLCERTIRRLPLTFYVGGTFLLMAPLTFGVLRYAQALQIHGWKLIALALVALLCLSQFAVAVMHWLSTLLVKPRLLPRMDFSGGIAADCRTMVVVPAILTDSSGVNRLLESLEIHYLANRDNNLRFALLSDFGDEAQERMPSDEALLQQVQKGIEALNQKYRSDRPSIFFLFHRPRLWNQAEGVWMGYERKRGKLAEFNALLRGRGRARFSLIVGDISLLPATRFVITLDGDTQLPRDVARQLTATLAHPLNRPQFDPKKGVVREGYSILQPRVGVSLPSASRSWFARIFTGDAGIDPYTRAVSDVYQDLFNEGTFIGKGIYDVDAFEQALEGRFQENTILSHDLIESVHARSALISDVELYEGYPSRYDADVDRRHRWIRGDWQIARWLLPRVPGADTRRIANPLSGLSKWKIFDNLRRSLVPAALTLLLLGSWILLPVLAGFASLLALAIVTIPGLLSVLAELMSKPKEWPMGMHFRGVANSFARQASQIALTLVFLPYDAFVSLDAIGRTLGRVLFTHKRLLEWQTSHEREHSARTDLAGFYRTMWITPFVALVALPYFSLRQPEGLFAASPFLAIWLLAPWIAWRISQPIEVVTPQLTEKQLAFLRRTARQTWRFFESFATERDNWLPADNFQEHPVPAIAPRTSPTNIGLALLSSLAACDFGYLSLGRLIERTRHTLTSMQRLERYRGHYFNWYDTRTFRALLPHYVSTVDSGNLAAHLLTFSAGLTEYADGKIVSPKLFAGLRDTAGVLRELVAENSLLERIDRTLENPPSTLREVYASLQGLAQEASKLIATLAHHSDEVNWWGRALEESCRDHLNDLVLLVPWLSAIQATGQLATIPVLRETLEGIPTLREVAVWKETLCPALEESWTRAPHFFPSDFSESMFWELLRAIGEASERAQERIFTVEALAGEVTEVAEMDFSFLFDADRELFAIGYNVTERRMDTSFYDLLASESRLGSFVLIAQGQVPQKHWFSLGRLVAAWHGKPVMVSWGGSMFEYLMPLLVMPTYENTLLDQTCKAAVDAQIDYGRISRTPWGVSESGYNLRDTHLSYQYRAFGVPGLGFKPGLADDLVIAPYATIMALMVAPKEACENLERLAAEKRMGKYGFYEAVDYTPSRLPPNQTSVTVRLFMSHHQGMSLLSLAYLLLDRPMQRRFRAHPSFKAEELLLQERVPRTISSIEPENLQLGEARDLTGEGENGMRVLSNPNTAVPQVHLLSNGRYHVMLTGAGGGYSRWQDLAVTRWREDPTRDCWGNFCYLRDVESGEFWSVTYQPTLRVGQGYEAIFTEARVEFRQQHGELEIHSEVGVSPEDDVESQRITLTNHGDEPRTIELTTYAEVVLAPDAADAAHPSFSKLFVQTEFIPQNPAILCTRRARSERERPPWLFHLMSLQGATEEGEVSFETDRAKFIGRGRTLAEPAALQDFSPLSNSAGSVLDPIISLRRTVTIAPDETVRVEIALGVAESRETAVSLAAKYHSLRMADRLFDMAWTHNQVTLRQLDASEADAQLYSQMASALIYADPLRRANPQVLRNNRQGQSGLWSYSISGDVPIVLLRISDLEKMELVRRVVQAHAYWRMKGLAVELVILNENTSVYQQSLHDRIVGLISSGIEAPVLDKPGGIFVRRLEQISAEDRVLFQAAARLVLSDENGTLDEQLKRPRLKEKLIPELEPVRARSSEKAMAPLPPRDLVFFNGLGGFTPDGREYIITLQPELAVSSPKISEKTQTVSLPRHTTPAPWINVLANPSFGTVVSESGGAYTWLENSHEFRLTPWNDDAVSGLSGEAFYIRDEETGEFWSPTPLPARGATPYLIRHGFGYTIFEHTEHGIASEASIYVAMDAPVKFVSLKLRNLTGNPRRLSVTGYWEWVLGELRSRSSMHVQTEIHPQTGALLARNPYNTEFGGQIVFVDVNEPGRSVTGDRKEFLGRNGTLANPAALKKVRLSGKTGPGLDPCAALQFTFDLAAQQTRQVTFRLGAGRNLQDVQELIRRYRQPDAPRKAQEGVWGYWSHTLGAVNVDTPDPATNLMTNGWLLYQTLSCRIWGRSGFYQSGGAFGFRDQLQDVIALAHAEPALIRVHLLRAAARQFREGDVQHWWHPPSGRGSRTHCSDDYLWLPYTTCRYVHCVNDTGILDERIPFLDGRPVQPEEEGYYDLPNRSEETGTLYEHCVRAIEHGLRFGEHGLPLIGSGDWNDGFNLVGAEGRGESVWLAFFLFDVLTQFAEVARRHDDPSFAERCVAQAAQLQKNIERHAWDGEWYRRAYFDNGEPLGSKVSSECQLDSIAQSWSVLSGAADPARARQGMKAVAQRLVRRNGGLMQLFDPPFDNSLPNPGYVKGYPPGIRENGGQYTHGAVWAVMAFAQLGQIEQAWEFFNLLNPIHHASTATQSALYKVEPYVVAADIYSGQPHVGRGGWTWYTGSAGWMYRLVTETLLGLRREGDKLRLEPRVPNDWSSFKIHYRYYETVYHITLTPSADPGARAVQIFADGQQLSGETISLFDDRLEHHVELQFPKKSSE
jgi:cyclic beta-1,2-glucan synthetase